MSTATPLDLKLAISGMSCSHCVARVRTALQAVPGVTVGAVTIGQAQVVVSHEAAGQAALAAVLDAGHVARIEASKPKGVDQDAGSV